MTQASEETEAVPSSEKSIQISIRDFAMPVLLSGSLDSHSGLRDKQDIGREIHERIQAKRKQEWNDRYQPELTTRWVFDRGGYRIDVQGRMDGILDAEGDRPLIEEIKSTFDLKELKKRLHSLHPYSLQLRTYGYFFHLQHSKTPELQLCLVSSRTGKTEEVDVPLAIEDYESWLHLRLDQLVQLAEKSLQQSNARKKWAKKIKFPFQQPRPGQRELIETIEEGAKSKKNQLLQAPTGLGKTVGVLYPTLREAFSKGQRLIYITPKNTQHAVAQEAVELLARQSKSKIKTLTVTSKAKLCQKPEPLCSPKYCEYARDYFDKIEKNDLLQSLGAERTLGAQVLTQAAKEFEVCPYELQFELAASRDLLICDYHYAIQAPSRLTHTQGAQKTGMEGEPILVIDEAHNLPSRAMDALSSSLSTRVLESYLDRLENVPVLIRVEMKELIAKAIRLLQTMGQGLKQSQRMDVSIGPFLEIEEEGRNLLSRYLDSDIEVAEKDPILSFNYLWSDFTESLLLLKEKGENSPFTSIFMKEPYTGDQLRIVCNDASEFLQSMHLAFERVVAFSATLKPFHHYLTLGGFDLERSQTEEFASPFASENRKLLIIPQASTRYQHRAKSTEKIAEAIHRIVKIRPGNYFAFFPSFEFLDQVQRHFQVPAGFCTLTQSRNMSRADIDAVIDHLKLASIPTVVFAVQGGVLSEGIDYPGNAIIGAFIIGPPLPAWNIEQKIRQDYYQKRFGDGTHHASTWPAMAKAIQAAGRVIRTETDRGIIVLFDDRFLSAEFSSSMPKDWFVSSPRELVSQQILSDIEKFWSLAPTQVD